MYLFKSDRLGFRAWKTEDVDPFVDMGEDSEVMQFFPKTISRNESIDLINRIKLKFAEVGYSLFAVDELDSCSFIGFIGFSSPTYDLGFGPLVEIGWRLSKDFWNKGYATEGATACLNYGFETLGLKEIYSLTSKVNIRSERVMQKIGMKKVDEFEHPKVEEGHKLRPHVLYKIEND